MLQRPNGARPTLALPNEPHDNAESQLHGTTTRSIKSLISRKHAREEGEEVEEVSYVRKPVPKKQQINSFTVSQ